MYNVQIKKILKQKKINLGPISLTDLSLFLGLNLTQSDSWLRLSLFVKLAPEVNFTNRLKSVLGLKSNTK